MFGPNRSYRLLFPIIRPLRWKNIYIYIYIYIYISSYFQFPFTEHWKSSWKIRASNVVFFFFDLPMDTVCLFVLLVCSFFSSFLSFLFLYIYIFFFSVQNAETRTGMKNIIYYFATLLLKYGNLTFPVWYFLLLPQIRVLKSARFSWTYMCVYGYSFCV